MKNNIRFFIPDIIIGLWGIIIGVFNNLKMRALRYEMISIKKDSLIIIGNGPSLKNTVEQDIEKLIQLPCMVVNGFATSPLFEKIKPKYYILADPVYFSPIQELAEGKQKVVCTLIENLRTKVNWEITFIFPCSAIGSNLLNFLETIPTAKFQYYNNKGNAVVLPDSFIKYWLWNHSCIGPLSQTVLNTAVSVAIKSKVQNIYLVGADTSWLATYEIDQEDNTLYTKDEHFYGINRIPLYSNEFTKEKQYLHNELLNVSAAFKAYYVLSKFAKYNNVNLYNASAYSWIDSLERKDLKRI